ncbi:type III-A CRISPR-associated RAMP protein Csm5 [Thermonema rossianum]|uniref:type III-A CRISPR-associated RAMP protein Csm5 n=1 Tax=Thermonema rossianum TaxID=55505 RepID=UPI000571A59B|nr:type III-A CRISPR-associated RAMP protein Csm5 [Thermonema rossianum]
MKVELRVLTPVHIGSQYEYLPFDYFIYQDKAYFQSDALVQRFLKEEAPALVEAYVEHVEQYAGKLASSSHNREQNKLRNDSSFAAFLQKQDPALRKKFAECLEKWGRQGVPLRSPGYPEQQIRAHQKSNGLPYIPATSLKGAIRSALLFDFLTRRADKKDLEDAIRRALQKAKEKKVKKERIDAGIEHMAFYAGVEKNKRINYKDEKFDVLKFLRLSDPTPDRQQAPALMVDKIKICILQKGQIEIQEQAPWAEVIAEESRFYFDLDIDLQAMAALRKLWDASNDQIQTKEGIIWKDIAQKMHHAFNFDWKSFDPASTESMQAARKKILTHIWNAIRGFSAAQLSHDSQWLETLAPHAQSNRMLFNGLKNTYNKLAQQLQQACLLHVGYATGFHGTTSFLAFHEIKDYIRLLEHYKIGLPPKVTAEGSYMKPARFPKSRRILSSTQADTPMGWIELLPEEEIELQAMEAELQQEETQPTPTLYTGKIKRGAVVPAVVEEPGKPNKVRLLIQYEHYGGELVPMTGYSAELEKGTRCEVSINQLDKKKKILQVGFKKIM